MPNTFTYVPSWSSSMNKKYAVTPVKFGDGYEQRAAEGINSKPRSWKLRFDVLSDADADAIEAFLDVENGVTAFYWTPPGKSQMLVRCLEFDRNYASYGNNVISCTFEEDFGS